MASNLFLSNQGASSAMFNLGKQLDGGVIDLYAGSSQPLNANTNTTSSHYILAEVSFSTTAGTIATSTFTASAMVATTATSSGICLFYRACSSSKVAILDGSVSTVSADMNFNTNNFANGASVSITSYVLILPEH